MKHSIIVLRNAWRLAILAGTLAAFASCSSEGDTDAPGSLPSDRQVIKDVTPKNKQGLIDVYTTRGKSGEAYLHPKELAWYFDRGVVIEREAGVPEAPDAVVIISGLARYVWTGNDYRYHKFLVTDNGYKNVPTPDDDDILTFVKSNLNKVFNSRDHKITSIESLDISKDAPRTWHTVNSFTVPFDVRYKYINSNTTVEEREAVMEIRLYRDNVESAMSNLMATEAKYKQLGVETFTQAEIKAMKTLRDTGSL